MDQFLEDVVLPELIKPSDKDKLEKNIIFFRKTLNDVSSFMLGDDSQQDKTITTEDFDIISNFVKEKSEYKEYLKNRKNLYSQYRPDLVFSGDEFNLKILSKDPMVTLFESEGNTKKESRYQINMQQGVPEILLEETSKYVMVGMFAHEYTHHTQAISAVDISQLIFNMNDEEKKYTYGIFRTLKEGQSLKMEEQISKLYAEKDHDVNYYEFISKDILSSMIKIYNVLNSKSKSNISENSFVFRNNNQEISDGDIGITYFMLNNLTTENYYDEFINRFVK